MSLETHDYFKKHSFGRNSMNRLIEMGEKGESSGKNGEKLKKKKQTSKNVFYRLMKIDFQSKI